MRIGLALAVLLAAIVGWLLGTFAPEVPGLSVFMEAARVLFLGALKLIVGPLIFFSLISGILRLRQAQQMRRLGVVTLLYYLGTTAIAITIGLLIVTFWHPWTGSPTLLEVGGVDAGGLAAITETSAANATLIDPQASGVADVLLGLLARTLTNPVTALAELNILAIVANALIIGLAGLATLPASSPLVTMVHHATDLVYRIAGWAVLLVPVGVLGIAFNMSSTIDTALIGQLALFMLVVFAATAIHGLLVLPLLAGLLTRFGPIQFLRAVASPALVALTTSSSAATLPVSLQTATTKLHVDSSIASFVLPLGATINMDGTALFEGIAAVFLAYLFGIPLGPAGVFVVFFVAMVASIGAPGIPSGSMAGMQVVLLSVGIPLEAIGLLLLIERPLDTFRTAVNVEGDLLATLVAQRFASATERIR